MKAPFTPFQLVMTVINLFMFICCIVGDVFILFLNSVEVNVSAYKINMILCVLAVIFFIVLTFKSGSLNIFGDSGNPNGDPKPAISVLHTYFCMLFFDFGGVLSLMFLGPLVFPPAKTVILIFAPAVFVLSAIFYFVKSSRIGLDDFDDENSDDN